MNKFVGIAFFALISIVYAGDHHGIVNSGLLHRVADVLSHGYGEKVILSPYIQKAHLVDYTHSVDYGYGGHGHGYGGGYGGGYGHGHGHGGYGHGHGIGLGHGGYGHAGIGHHHGGYVKAPVIYRGYSAHGGHHGGHYGGYHK